MLFSLKVTQEIACYHVIYQRKSSKDSLPNCQWTDSVGFRL